jgi:hypothetical protein
MNWRASLLAAVIVIAAGAAVGVAIGGKTTHDVKTVTVTQVSAAPTPSPTTTTSAAPGVTATTPAGVPTTSAPAAVSPQFLDTDDTPTKNDNIDIVADQTHPREQIGGEIVTDAVILAPFGISATAPASVTYSTTSPDYKFLRARMGFKHGTPAGADITIDFRKDSETGPMLVKTQRFHLPGPRSITVPLNGARNVTIVLNNNSCHQSNGTECTVPDPTFVLGMARFTG